MKQRAFTVIELLVVIAIIGVIASIILVSLKSAKEKAKVAAGLNFAAQVHHALGAYAVGIWDFDEGSGGIAKDTSGNGNDGDIVGATWSAEGNTPSGKGYALSFDGSNDYISISNNPIFNIQTLTIVAWVNFSDNSSSFVFEKGNVNTQYSLFSHGTDIVFRTKPVGEAYDTLSTTKANAGITNNKWHFITATFDGKTKKLYVDGKLKLSRDWEKVIETNPNGSSIGRFGGTTSGYFFTGLIDDVRIYEQALTSAQIRKLYVEGAKGRGLLTGE